jgi:replicative DNA helicase
MSAETVERSTVYLNAETMILEGTPVPESWAENPDVQAAMRAHLPHTNLVQRFRKQGISEDDRQRWPVEARFAAGEWNNEPVYDPNWRENISKPGYLKFAPHVNGKDGYHPGLADKVTARATAGLSDGSDTGTDGWDEPLPLGEATKLPCPPLDTVAPPALARMADAVAASYQVPADLPLLLGISTIAAAIGGRFILDVKPDWEEQLSIYALIALTSANRKSPVFNAMTGVMKRYETHIIEEGREPRGMHNAEGERIEARKRKLEKILADSGRLEVEDRAELEGLTKQSIEFDEWQDPQLIANDTTPEALASIMRYNGNRMAIMAPEAGVFNVIAGLYNGGQPNVDIFLSGWCGDNITINRKGNAGPIKLDGPALSVGLTTQPEMISQLSEKKNFRGSGLLARFLYAVPNSLLGSRELDSPPVPQEIRSEWETSIQDLLEACHPDRKFEDREKKDPVRMALSGEATKVLNKLRAEIEPQLKENTGELAAISDWGGKIVGQLARIAALYTLFENAHTLFDSAMAGGRYPIEVSGEAMTRAVTLAPYLTSHALAAFGSMNPNAGRYSNAASIVAAIKAKPESRGYGFTARDVHVWVKRQTWAKEGGAEEVKAALMDLLDSGHIAPAQNQSARRNAAQRYDANPHLFTD